MLIFALACGLPDQPGPPGDDSGSFTFEPTSNLCGTVSGEAGAEVQSVGVMTIREGYGACTADTGGHETWWDTLVTSPEPEGADGRSFQATVDPGTYGVMVVATGDTPLEGCGSVAVPDDGECAGLIDVPLHEIVSIDKPNVYLYPEALGPLSVRIPAWQRITEADPAYPVTGWHVLAEPDGRLHTQAGSRDYLFYEMAVDPARFQFEAGWCVPGALVQASIEDAMADLGFQGNEIGDFGEAWDGTFPTTTNVTVYPQLEGFTALRIDPLPDVLLRAWFVVAEGCRAVDAPVLPHTERTGFHAAEWGVAFEDPGMRPALVIDGWR